MKPKHSFYTITRVVLGLYLILYAVNKFIHIVPTSYDKMPEITRDFIDSIAVYLPYLYIFEILVGFFLILNRWTAFWTIVLFPLTIAFLIFNITNNDINTFWPAAFVAILNIFLLIKNKEIYIPLFDGA